MAIVRLTLDEAADGYLPETCLKCGQKAEHWVKKKFSWHPSWIWILLLAGVLPFAIVAAILTKRATMLAPMCTAHRRHWMIRTAVMVIGLLAIVVLIVLLIVVSSEPPGRRNDLLPAIFGFALVGGGFAWIVAMIVLGLAGIRPQEITDYDLTLQGVSDQFADDFDRCVEEEEEKEIDERARGHRPRSRSDRGSRDDDRYR